MFTNGGFSLLFIKIIEPISCIIKLGLFFEQTEIDLMKIYCYRRKISIKDESKNGTWRKHRP